MNLRFVKISSLLLVLSVCPLTHAATRYVSHSGNNTFPYTTWETAANTIEAANLATLPGDTMFVDTGSFYLSAPVYTQPKITIRGRGMDSTRVIGSDTPEALRLAMFLPEDSILVEGVHFIGSGSIHAFAKYATEPDRSFWFLSCRFSSFGSSAISCGNNRYIEIRSCYFDTWDSWALFLTGRGSYLIENNTFYMPGVMKDVCGFINHYRGTTIVRSNIFVGGSTLTEGGGTLLSYHQTCSTRPTTSKPKSGQGGHSSHSRRTLCGEVTESPAGLTNSAKVCSATT